MGYRILHRKWIAPRWMWILMVLELLGLVPVLVLFGIAQPDLYRTKLWQIGFDNQFNSNPKMILYAYANYQPLPEVPMVWSQFLTNLNVAISIVALFVLLIKLIAYIMKVWYPLVALVINIGLVAIWTLSMYGQMGPDHADPRYPSNIAWYISKSCDYAAPYKAVKSCQLAKATFGVTVYMLFLFVVNLGITIWALLPKETDKISKDSDNEDSPIDAGEQKQWEMHGMPTPATPGRAVPYTPRTMAFQTLDRKLPLRTQYS